MGFRRGERSLESLPMPGNEIASLWARVVEHAGKPFLTDKGREPG